MEKDLKNLAWTVEGFHKYVPMQKVTMETGVTHKNLTGIIPATVPGGLHVDLYRAGLIEHPYMNMDSVKSEWTENRWWVYRTEFDAPKTHGKVTLIFKGIDYEVSILVNNVHKVDHRGMYQFLYVDISEECRHQDTISLTVVFKGIPDEMGQVGKTSLTSTQKARFNYKWDFSCRLVNIGFWREIILKTHEICSLRDVYIHTGIENGNGTIDINAEIVWDDISDLHECEIKAALSFSGHPIQTKTLTVTDTKANGRIVVENPALWNVNGFGDANLYQLDLSAVYAGRVVDTKQYNVGIRSLEYRHNDSPAENALPYTFVINGSKVYIKGVNFTPLDHMYGNVTYEHYEQMILTAKNMHVNMIRIWGGGIIEKEEFYSLCDKHGILVFQEFIQSSSGIDNIPCKAPEFLTLLKANAIDALKEKRNHVCLAVWSGGNELMDADGIPTDYTDMNISMLRGLVEKYDPQRLFLPTSASGPSEGLSKTPYMSHDIHGSWEYLGNPSHYDRYHDSDSLFHSEFGTEGLCNLKTIKKYVDEKYLRPMDVGDHIIWKHRGQWWGTYTRDLYEFGSIDDMRHFQNISQWLQAEGLRFILEQNRSRKFENSGSIIWQFNEPWPNINGTFLVDYCLEQKMAYYWAKKAYEPVHASLRYKRLDYPVNADFTGTLFLNNTIDKRELDVVIKVRNKYGHVIYMEEKRGVHINPNASVQLRGLCFKIAPELEGLFFVTLHVYEDQECRSNNLYVFSTESVHPYQASQELRCAAIESSCIEKQLLDDGELTMTYKITNTGPKAAMHIRAIETSDAFWFYSDKMFETLFPGESCVYRLRLRRKSPSGFMLDNYDPHVDPTFIFEAF